MSIQIAGEQKYYDFIEERVKKLRTGMIVWGSLLGVAFIGMFSDVRLALILASVGIALAILNLKSQQALKGKLEGIEDKEEFFRQLADTDLVEVKEARLMITKDYVLGMKEDVFVYSFSEMDKVEVGLQGKVGKTLFLTDRQGIRHEIMSCVKDDGKQEMFDKIYGVLSERV